MYQLILNETKEKAVIGKIYKDFRGEEWVLDGWSIPHHPGSTGRVYVYKPDKDKIETAREFFPDVLNMKIVEVKHVI